MPMSSTHLRPSANRRLPSSKALEPGLFVRTIKIFHQFALPVLLLGASVATAAGQSSAEPSVTASSAFTAPASLTPISAFASSQPFSSSLDTPEPNQPSLPDAPDPQAAQTRSARPPSSKRVFGIIPNFRTVSTDEKLPRMSVKAKFTTAFQDSFDYSSIFIPAALAGYSLGINADPEFGGGGLGYARYLWHAAADQTQENFLVEAILPSITHEDPRFYSLSRGSFVQRTEYSLTRAFVTRSDNDREVFNASEIFGSGIAAGVSSLYYPTRERSLGNTTKQWGLNIGVDAIAFVVKEFAPDITQKVLGPKNTNH